MPGLPQLRRLDLAYDGGDADESARRLCFSLFPHWETDPGELELKHFTEGITNTLLRVTKVWPGATPPELDSESVLIRAYGRGTELIIDREREITTHHLLALHNLAPELLARFQNGMIYRFVSGRPCGPLDMRAPRVYRGLAQKLGEWHAVISVSTQTQTVSSNGEPVEKSASSNESAESHKHGNYDSISAGVKNVSPNVWTVLEKWINVLPANTPEEQSRNENFRKEFAWIVSEFADRPGLGEDSLVVGHGDLLCANIIILPRPPRKSAVSEDDVAEVALIDYEYATPCQAAFDLACHFSEWIGFECDYSGIPTRHDRRQFLAEYLHSYRRHARRTSFNHLRDEPFKVPVKREDSGENVPQINGTGQNGHVSMDAKTKTRFDREEEELNRLCEEVDFFRGLPGFFWGVWGFIQASISDIDFDYAWYAKTRMREYWDWKAEITGSREQEGSKPPLREERWNLK